MIQAFLFFPSLKSSTVQKMLCVLVIPDIALFIYLNVIVFQEPSKVCSGEYLDPEAKADASDYLLSYEHRFLFISLMCMWAIAGYAIVVIGCVHTCFTFCFRV